jgi:uracil-DNA glycosylase family 4
MCSVARRIVLGRGTVPCDVLFIGEAPGQSEDTLGRSFVGPAGKLLDNIIECSLGVENSVRRSNGHPELTHALTNVVGCMPRGNAGNKAGEPDLDQIECCIPRLEAFVEVCRPRLVVCVGKISKEWLEPGIKGNVKYDAHDPRNVRRVVIDHPAFILRSNVANQGLLRQRAIVTIGTAVEELT